MRINWEFCFVPYLPKNGFWCRNFENLTLDLESALSRYHVCQFSGKTGNFDFFRPNFAKNQFCGRNFKNLSLNLESAPPRYHLCQFLIKTDKFEFFGLNLRKLPNFMRYSGSNNVDVVVKSWVEAKMSWVGVDGAGWSWVHGLAIPVIFFLNASFSLTMSFYIFHSKDLIVWNI